VRLVGHIPYSVGPPRSEPGWDGVVRGTPGAGRSHQRRDWGMDYSIPSYTPEFYSFVFNNILCFKLIIVITSHFMLQKDDL